MYEWGAYRGVNMSTEILSYSKTSEPVKVVSVTSTHLTFDGSFWDGYNQRYERIRSVVDRRFLYNHMSHEYASRNNLSKYNTTP